MDVKSLAAGALLAFGLSNLLGVLGMPFAVPNNLVEVSGIPIGTLVVALLAIGIGYYLIKGKK